METLTLKNKEIVNLSNNFSGIVDFQFPGVLVFYENIQILNSFIEDINKEYRDIINKHFNEPFSVKLYDDKGNLHNRNIMYDSFDIRYHSLGDVDEDFTKEIKKVDDKEFTIKLNELDVLKPVFLVKDKIKIILRDYLEQTIDPLDLLFYPAKLGLIKNLFNHVEENSGKD